MALAALSVLAALAWRGVDGMLRSREITQTSIERTTRLNTVLTQLRQDLESLVDPGTSLATPAAVEFDGRALRLVRSEGPALRIVAWTRIDNVWRRWQSPPVTRIGELQEQWFRSLQLQGNEPEQVRLLEGVEELQVYFRGPDGTRFNAQSTGNVAPVGAATGQQRLQVPRVVELNLTVGGLKLQRSLLTALRG